jgi:hypothetical protein
MEGVYKAMRATFDVPENDRFMTVSEHASTMGPTTLASSTATIW